MDISDEEIIRWRSLQRICHVTRHGIVEGIEFDFRHELLAPSDWGMHAIGVESAPHYRMGNGPFIWFPWYGEFSKDRLRREAVSNYEDEKQKWPQRVEKFKQQFPDVKVSKNMLAPLSVKRYMSEFTPDYVISSGEKLFITYVHRHVFGDEFDHPHDAEVRYALLGVRRANGKILHLKHPLTFNGHTAICVAGAHYNYFDKIYHRICRYFDLPSLEQIDWDNIDVNKMNPFANSAAMHAQSILVHTKRIRELAMRGNRDEPEGRMAWRAWHAIEDAVYLGYLWAKAEAELGMKPLAISARRAKDGASSGGAKSGESRKQKRAKTWEPIAKEMALKNRAERPFASQDDVATDIAHGWKDANVKAPGHTTLKALISSMEQAGELPKRRSK